MKPAVGAPFNHRVRRAGSRSPVNECVRSFSTFEHTPGHKLPVVHLLESPLLTTPPSSALSVMYTAIDVKTLFRTHPRIHVPGTRILRRLFQSGVTECMALEHVRRPVYLCQRVEHHRRGKFFLHRIFRVFPSLPPSQGQQTRASLH